MASETNPHMTPEHKSTVPERLNFSNGEEKLLLRAFDWQVEDCATDDNEVVIHAWCHNKKNQPYLLRILGLPAFCYIELPEFIGTKYQSWHRKEDSHKVETLFKHINRLLGVDQAILQAPIMLRQKLYYYNTRKYPMLLASFKNLESMRKCKYLLDKPLNVPDIGLMRCTMHEDDIPMERKLWSLRNLRVSDPFTCIANVVSVTGQIRATDKLREYCCQWDTMDPASPEVIKAMTGDSSFNVRPKVAAYDGEMYSDKHKAMPHKLEAKHVCYMISVICKRLGDPDDKVTRYGIIFGDCNDIPESKLKNCTIIRTNSEYTMFEAFAKVIVEEDPDILTGYNILGFDNAYFDARIKRKLKEWPRMGRTNKKTSMWTKNWASSAYGHNSINMIVADGRITIDMFPIIKRNHKLKNYKLETVGKKFLNKGKHDVKPIAMFEAYEAMTKAAKLLDLHDNEKPRPYIAEAEAAFKVADISSDVAGIIKSYLSIDRYQKAMEDITEVMEYCIQDSELIPELIEVTNTYVDNQELSSIVGVTITQLSTRGQQIRCLSQIYDIAQRRGIVLTKRFASAIKSFSGGAVQKPITGLHENVICLDFASLYPSIMMQMNICYTTLVGPEHEKDIPDALCNIIEFDQEEEPDTDSDEDEPAEKKTVIKHYRYRFLKEPRGLLPELVKHLVDERGKAKNMLKGEKDPIMKIVLDRRQNGLKVSANSMFGFLGVRNGKLPLMEGAMSITARGRELIEMVNVYLKTKYKYGYKAQSNAENKESKSLIEPTKVSEGKDEQKGLESVSRIIYGDSVTGDTPLLIQLPYKAICYCPIEALADLITRTVGPQLNLTGDKERLDVSRAGFSVWSDKGWTTIKQIIKHATKKRLYRVLTHTGCVDVTEDHSLLDPEGKEIKPMEVKVGSILLHRDMPNVEYDFKISEDLAWAYGFFYAEGTCGSYLYDYGLKNSWSIANRDNKALKRAQEIFRKYETSYEFIIDPCMEYSNCDKLNIRGKNLNEIVTRYRKMFYYDKYKRVPEIILMSPIKVKEAFFQGYYEGDGSKTEGTLRFDNKGKIGAAGLYYLASCLGYNVSINIRSDKEQIYRCNLSKAVQRKASNAIKKIVDLGITEDYVYDLETENHHFAAGVGRMIVHNTDSVMCTLGITDKKEVNRIGRQLAIEISGDPDKGIAGLFPPPLRMEFEKGMRLFCITKKRYAALLIRDNGEFKTDPKDVLIRGIDIARRDKCAKHLEMYEKILMNILNKLPFIETMTYLIDNINLIRQGQVPVQKFAITRELGAAYKNHSYFMKVFADYLNSIGKPANPGDRLEYVIVKNPDVILDEKGKEKKDLLGRKMRLLEQIEEDPKSYEVDTSYYLTNLFTKPFDTLISIGYAEDIKMLPMITYRPTNKHKPTTLAEPMKIIVRMISVNKDINSLLEAIKKELGLVMEPPKVQLRLITPKSVTETKVVSGPVPIDSLVSVQDNAAKLTLKVRIKPVIKPNLQPRIPQGLLTPHRQRNLPLTRPVEPVVPKISLRLVGK